MNGIAPIRAPLSGEPVRRTTRTSEFATYLWVRMLTTIGSAVQSYFKDEEYQLDEATARWFIREGWAEKATEVTA